MDPPTPPGAQSQVPLEQRLASRSAAEFDEDRRKHRAWADRRKAQDRHAGTAAAEAERVDDPTARTRIDRTQAPAPPRSQRKPDPIGATPTVAEFARCAVLPNGKVVPLADRDRTTMWPWTCPRHVAKQSTFVALATGVRPFIREFADRELESFDVSEAVAIFRRYPPFNRRAVARLMQDATLAGAITSNPFSGLGMRGPRPRIARKDFRLVTPEEVERLRAAALAHHDPEYGLVLRAMLELAIDVGLRPSELFGLERADIDVATGRAHVRQQVTEADGICLPKNGQMRWVPFSGQARDAFLAAPRLSERWAYPTPTGNHFQVQTFYRFWWAIRARAGLPHLRFYELRHLAITRMLTGRPHGLGLDLLTVAEIVGQSDAGATLARHYAFIDQARAIDRYLVAETASAGPAPPSAPREEPSIPGPLPTRTSEPVASAVPSHRLTAASAEPGASPAPTPALGPTAEAPQMEPTPTANDVGMAVEPPRTTTPAPVAVPPSPRPALRVPTVAEFAGLEAAPDGRVIPRGGRDRSDTWPWTFPRGLTKESSFRTIASSIYRFVRQHGDRPLDSFDVTEAIEIFRDYSPTHRRIVCRFMNDARRAGLIERNPFARLGMEPKRARINRLDFWVVTDEQLARICNIAVELQPGAFGLVLRAMILFVAHAGARPGEALGLERSDIDLAAERAYIRQQIDRLGHVSEPKHGQKRWVPFTGPVKQAYMDAPQLSDQWAFAAVDGQPLRHQRFRYHWSIIRAAAGMPKLKFYELRHRAITAMVTPPPHGFGLDRATVAAIVGHADGGETIARYYLHVDQAQAIERFRAAEQTLAAGNGAGTQDAAPDARLWSDRPATWRRHMHWRLED